jgi:biopolymer transport protein ExbB/TolQ
MSYFALSNSEVMDVVERTLEGKRKLVHAELKKGLGGLATIASTASFVGLLGTVMGIINAFKGVGMQKVTYMAATSAGISEALVTTAFGLFVAVPAAWSYNYFSRELENLDIDLANSSLELTTYLVEALSRQRQNAQSRIGF